MRLKPNPPNKMLRILRLLLTFTAAIFFSVSASHGQGSNPAVGNPEKFSVIVTPGTKPILVHDGVEDTPGLTFTEGPAWMDGRLYFSNYYIFWKPYLSVKEGGPMAMEPDGTIHILNRGIQTCGMIPLASGNLAVCDIMGRRVMEMTPEGKYVRTLADNFEGAFFGGPNDVVVDAKGGIYFTDPHGKSADLPGAAVFYINPEGKVIRVTEWDVLEFPNGCVLSPDGRTFYLNDSITFDVLAFDVRADGTLANKRKFADLVRPTGQENAKRSNADGMTVDIEGNIYVATPSGIQVFDKSGGLLGVIEFPKSSANCIFGGPDMKTLYVTARDCVYSIRTNIPGLTYPPK